MAKDEDGDDLMAQGLIGMSYDSVFAIRKRVRKFGDFTIPLRGGLTYAQLGTGLITLVVMFFVYAIVVAPLSAAMRLSPLSNLGLMAFVLFAPPVIVAQRMIAPMPHGKTIGGYLRSLMRFTFDDKVYRRGRPIDTPTTHREGPMRHDWIVWEPAEEFSEELSTDLLLTRESIERRFTGTVTDLASAQQSVSRQHLADERARAERDAVSEKDDYELRHTDASGVTGL